MVCSVTPRARPAAFDFDAGRPVPTGEHWPPRKSEPFVIARATKPPVDPHKFASPFKLGPSCFPIPTRGAITPRRFCNLGETGSLMPWEDFWAPPTLAIFAQQSALSGQDDLRRSRGLALWWAQVTHPNRR